MLHLLGHLFVPGGHGHHGGKTSSHLTMHAPRRFIHVRTKHMGLFETLRRRDNDDDEWRIACAAPEP